MLDSVHPDWQPLLAAQRERLAAIFKELENQAFVPQASSVFRAFEISPREYRVLILGQDPYPNPAHAMGLAFAVPVGTQVFPPTLKNIYRELQSDLSVREFPNLADWQNRGVFLLNRHLTTAPNQTAAHLSLGWGEFTLAAAEFLVEVKKSQLVSILWGNKAQEIQQQLGLESVISSAHPSPLSAYRGFYGSRPFSKANQLLRELGEQPIEWV